MAAQHLNPVTVQEQRQQKEEEEKDQEKESSDDVNLEQVKGVNRASSSFSPNTRTITTAIAGLDGKDQGVVVASDKNNNTDDDRTATYGFLAVLIVLAVIYLSKKVKQWRRPSSVATALPTQEELRRLRQTHLETYSTIAPPPSQAATIAITRPGSESVSIENSGNDKDEEKKPASRKSRKSSAAKVMQPTTDEVISSSSQAAKDPVIPEGDTKSQSDKKIGQSRRLRSQVELPPRKWNPIKSAADLLAWEHPSIAEIAQCRGVEAKAKRNESTKFMLVVHDMAGNYNIDSLVDGWYSKNSQEGIANWVWGFRPVHFSWMEAFVYFSHNLISIPPRGWIDSAHRHGTRVLGTFLTEWEQGEVSCATIFDAKNTTEAAAYKLSKLREAHGFDGWLVNIENKLTIGQIPNVLYLLELLSSQGNAVIWYDSVLSETGELRWQNGLNDKNSEFFKRANCGILTNYGWREEKVKVSNATAKSLSLPVSSIWQGIDVFGRGTFGDGGMNCGAALNLLDQLASPSACLFAPGWVMEVAAEKNPLMGKTKELEFWGKIIANTAWGENVSQMIQIDTSKKGFYTDFCDGGGPCLYSMGEKVQSHPWLDLRRQTVQPRWDVLTLNENDDVKTQKRVTIRCTDTVPVFSGNCSIQLVGRRVLAALNEWMVFPLLSVQSRLGGTKGPGSVLTIRAAVFCLHGDLAISIHIAPRDFSGQPSRLMLVPQRCELPNTLPAIGERYHHGWVVRTWELRTYELRGRNLTGVGVAPLPVNSASGTDTWLDAKVGMISMDEVGSLPTLCEPTGLQILVDDMILKWTCACSEEQHVASGANSCTELFGLVHVNGKFKGCGFSKEFQMSDVAVGLDGKIIDEITVRSVRWDGSCSNDVKL